MIENPTFSDENYTAKKSWQKRYTLPANLQIKRAQTQENVNTTLLNYLVQKFSSGASLTILDLPCGNMEFATYVKMLFPSAHITAADVAEPELKSNITFLKMDASKAFLLSPSPQFDLITSISGIMMFGNTAWFVEQCVERLKKGGTYLITNDNSATLKDKITFLLFGKTRMFPPVFSDAETLTQNIPIQELIRLLMINKMVVKDIVYTSANSKDYFIRPFCAIIYLLTQWYLRRFKNVLPQNLVKKMYPFRHLYCRHYIIIAEKV